MFRKNMLKETNIRDIKATKIAKEKAPVGVALVYPAFKASSILTFVFASGFIARFFSANAQAFS